MFHNAPAHRSQMESDGATPQPAGRNCSQFGPIQTLNTVHALRIIDRTASIRGQTSRLDTVDSKLMCAILRSLTLPSRPS